MTREELIERITRKVAGRIGGTVGGVAGAAGGAFLGGAALSAADAIFHSRTTGSNESWLAGALAGGAYGGYKAAKAGRRIGRDMAAKKKKRR